MLGGGETYMRIMTFITLCRLLRRWRQRQSQAFSEFVEISEESPYGEFRHATPVTTSEVEIPTWGLCLAHCLYIHVYSILCLALFVFCLVYCLAWCLQCWYNCLYSIVCCLFVSLWDLSFSHIFNPQQCWPLTSTSYKMAPRDLMHCLVSLFHTCSLTPSRINHGYIYRLSIQAWFESGH